jgi:chaperone required for assembly of F1-ATPase
MLRRTILVSVPRRSASLERRPKVASLLCSWCSMRDLFECTTTENPMQAARRGARPALRRRFYENVTVAATPDGHAVQLDGKPVHTPARRLLAAPTPALARALVEEWNAQTEVVDPAKMPLTRLANSIIDGVADTPQPVADEIKKYLASDPLFYRADAPQGLVERQAQYWDPILRWAAETLGAKFYLAEGVVHVAQPEAALAAAHVAVPDDPWRLGAAHVITTLTGSALIALAMARGHLSEDAAWQAAHVDEDWNTEQWGRDEMATQRRDFRFAEFRAAAAVLKN